MTTLKRLGDDDVRAVFSCLRSHDLPPPHLHFQIVPVGPRGLKLSPPSHEFEDGLYVLLRPQKSKKKSNEIDPRDRVPSQLSHLIMTELPPETCPWSLSGPQFPAPTNIQQRYCYPKGRLEYSSRKGGALWTMCDDGGKEDTEYRLLHVYLSPKRAANKGVDLSTAEKALVHERQQSYAATAASPSAKRSRYSRKPVEIHRRSLLMNLSDKTSLYRQYRNLSVRQSSVDPTSGSPPHLGAAALAASPPSLSPLSFDRLPTTSTLSPSSNYRDSINQSTRQPYASANMASEFAPSRTGSGQTNNNLSNGNRQYTYHDMHERATFVTPVHGKRHCPPYYHAAADDRSKIRQESSFFYPHHRVHPHLPHHDHNLHQSPLQRRTSFLDDARADPFWNGYDRSGYADVADDHDPGHRLRGIMNDEGENLGRPASAETAKSNHSHSSFPELDFPYWEHQNRPRRPQPSNSTTLSTSASGGSSPIDPFATLVIDKTKILEDTTQSTRTDSSFGNSHHHHHCAPSSPDVMLGVTSDFMMPSSPSSGVQAIVLSPPKALARRLEILQCSLRGILLSFPAEQQGELVSVVVQWASRLKLDPLASLEGVDEDSIEPTMAMDGRNNSSQQGRSMSAVQGNDHHSTILEGSSSSQLAVAGRDDGLMSVEAV